MEMENLLLITGGDFELYCLQLKKPVGIPKILMLFPVGIRVQYIFPIGMKFQGIFLNGNKFLADFSSEEGVQPGLRHGVPTGTDTTCSLNVYSLVTLINEYT